MNQSRMVHISFCCALVDEVAIICATVQYLLPSEWKNLLLHSELLVYPEDALIFLITHKSGMRKSPIEVTRRRNLSPNKDMYVGDSWRGQLVSLSGRLTEWFKYFCYKCSGVSVKVLPLHPSIPDATEIYHCTTPGRWTWCQRYQCQRSSSDIQE